MFSIPHQSRHQGIRCPYIFIISLFLFITQTSYAEKSSISLSVPDISSLFYHTPEQTGFADEVLSLALKRIGYTLTLHSFPTERSLKMANTGVTDGELIRTQSIEKQYPNLIRVPENLASAEFMVFSRTPINVSQGWQSLKGKSVGVIIGMKIIEQNLPASARKIEVRDINSLFQLLINERADCVVFAHMLGENFLSKHAIDKVLINEPKLASVPLFTYLNNNHIELVPQLAHALKTMKKDNSYQILANKHWQKHKAQCQKPHNSNAFTTQQGIRFSP